MRLNLSNDLDHRVKGRTGPCESGVWIQALCKYLSHIHYNQKL